MSAPSQENPEIAKLLDRAVDEVRRADALLIGAGAGMGVDSGLPDFRGDEGFWKAYPPIRDLGYSFIDMADPSWFRRDPALAWGFYGHRLELYRSTQPHRGFALLKDWCEKKRGGGFIYTSNVDGQFQKAGFKDSHIVECHGSIHSLQCLSLCRRDLWSAEGIPVDVNLTTIRAREPLPRCQRCKGLARPNILMFGDGGWLGDQSEAQERQLNTWLARLEGRRILTIEIGAGTAIPSVRQTCRAATPHLIRINPRQCEVRPGQVGLALGALEALSAINKRL